MRLPPLPSAFLLALTLAGTAAAQVPATDPVPASATGSVAGPRAGTAALSRDDREFIRNAAASGLAELQGSQLAAQVAQDDSVRRFAQQEVRDHGTENAELAELARRKGVELPATPELVEQGRLQFLQSVRGPEFDLRYVQDLGVKAAQGTLALFRQQAEHGGDPEVRRFAQQALPRLQARLQVAQQLQAQVAAAAQAGDAGSSSMGAGSEPVPPR